jgi:hypothetical protein
MLAAFEIRKGSKALANGSAMLTIALKDAMEVRLAYTVDGDGFGFALSEYREPVLNKDGTKSGKHQTARLSAIMVDLLGEPVGAISDAVKTAFNKAYPAAVLLRFEPAFSEVTIENGNLANIPLANAIDLTKAEVYKNAEKAVGMIAKQAKQTFAGPDELMDAVYATTVECDGSKDGLFGKVPTTPQIIESLGKIAEQMGLVEPKGSRAPRTPSDQDEGQSLVKAMTYVLEKMGEQVDGDEASISMTEAMDAKAYTLWITLGAYLENRDMV